jgi:phosphatidylinositol alpha-1,6-mannosyltransferase
VPASFSDALMRVLVVTHYFAEHGGGVEIVAGEIASGLATRGHSVTWVSSELTGTPGPPTEPSISRVSVRAWNVAEERVGVPYPLWGPSGLKNLMAAVRCCDVVHIHDCLYMGSVVASLAARRVGRPMVVTQHVGWIPYSRVALRVALSISNRVLGRLVLGGASRCTFVSAKVSQYFGRFVSFARGAVLIPNGVSLDRFHPLPDGERAHVRAQLGWDGPVVLFVGRFVEKKGLAYIRALATAIPDCRFVLVGWGPIQPGRWRLPNVTCVGALGRDEVVRYYQAADLLLLPSVGEGFPLVVQESMACGTPVLLSEDTARGLDAIRKVAVVSVLDEDALERVLRQELAEPVRLRGRRELARAFASVNWSWTKAVDAYEEVLLESLRASVGRRAVS